MPRPRMESSTSTTRTRFLSGRWRLRGRPKGETELLDLTLEAERTVEPRSGAFETVKRDSRRRRGLAIADVGALLVAYGLVGLVVTPDASFDLSRLPYLGALPAWVVLNKLLHLYDRDANLIHRSTLNEFPAIAQSITLGVGSIFLFAPLVLDFTMSRAGFVTFWALAMVLTPLARYGARELTRRNEAPERCLIVGAGEVSDMLARKIEAHAYGVEVVGVIGMAEDGEPSADTVRDGNGTPRRLALADFTEFEALAREHAADRVVIAFSRLPVDSLLEIIQISKLLELKVSVLPRLFEMIGHSVEVDQIEGMTLFGVRGFTRTRSSLALKRAMDLSATVLGGLVLLPLLLAAAIAVKATSHGPVFYRQRRIGRDNAAFTLVKFRTMVEGADSLKPSLQHLNEADGVMFKIAEDPRITRIGRFLRRTSLDELPQLWNVLRGEMSLVGPRPLVPEEDGHVIGYHRERLALTPGLTGPWQVLGRTSIPFHEMVKLDYLYVAEWSLWNDIKLLLRTAPVVFLGRGA